MCKCQERAHNPVTNNPTAVVRPPTPVSNSESAYVAQVRDDSQETVGFTGYRVFIGQPLSERTILIGTYRK